MIDSGVCRSQLLESERLWGRDRRRTRRALLLATGFFVVITGFDFALSTVPYDRVPGVAYGARHAFLIDADIDLLAEVGFAPGLVIVVGLAAIHAFFNAGYLPSIILATAPVYSVYLFTVPGPMTGPVIPLSTNVVFAPLWAAMLVVPNTVAYGTLGFLLGTGLQRFYARGPRCRTSPVQG